MASVAVIRYAIHLSVSCFKLLNCHRLFRSADISHHSLWRIPELNDKVENSGHGFLERTHRYTRAMELTQFFRLLCLLTASLISRALTSPVATQHQAAFDEIVRVNEQYGKILELPFQHAKRFSSFDQKPFQERLPISTRIHVVSIFTPLKNEISRCTRSYQVCASDLFAFMSRTS